MAEKIKTLSLQIYRRGAQLAENQGIIIADTKFEFGLVGNEIYLIDEILTPDSSRFLAKRLLPTGGSQKSFDKQYIRDYLLSIRWNKKPPAPSLPSQVLKSTQKKYLEALKLLTGKNYEF
jgi:phosphoribosylaminoimidazole-succinocarboxamide synthase